MVETLDNDNQSDNDSWGLDEEDYCLATSQSVANFGEEHKVFTAAHSNPSSFTFINQKDIEKVQTTRILEVSEQFGISLTLARAILIKCGWKVEVVIDALLNDERYISKTFNFSIEGGERNNTKNKQQKEFTCPCCYCECEDNEIIQMEDCGHRLCNDCFGGHCQQNLVNGNEVVNTICPDGKCRAIVSERIFKQVLTKLDFDKYLKFVMESFVTLSKNAKWCPGKGCGKVCESKYGEAVEIHCACGTSFCFGCKKEPHAPIQCDMLQIWIEKIG